MKRHFSQKIFIFTCFFLTIAHRGIPQEVKTYELSIKEISELALKNNFDIQLAQYDLWIKRTDQQVAESIYDTMLNAGVGYRDNQRKQVSTIFGEKTVDNEYNVGLARKLPSGTTLGVEMAHQRQFSDSPFTISSVTHGSSLAVSIDQDLGKNFFGLKDRGNVHMTRLDIENVEFLSLDKIEMYLAHVQNAYWDLVLEMENVAIEEDMVRQAKRLDELHQEKFKSGLVEKTDIIASQANYQRRRNDLVLAENSLKGKTNVLKYLLNIPEDEISIVPTDQFQIPDAITDFQQALKEAFERRRDYKMAHNEIKNRDIQLAIEKNNSWPEINLSASLARNGLGDHFKEASTHIADEDNPDFRVGLEFNFPLENSAAGAQSKAADLAKAKAIIRLKSIERKISIEIMDRVRDCNTFRGVALSDEKISILQQEKLAEEEKRFQLGRSSTDILIRFQEDVILDRLRAAQAKYRYHLSQVDLQLKTGDLLHRYWSLSDLRGLSP